MDITYTFLKYIVQSFLSWYYSLPTYFWTLVAQLSWYTIKIWLVNLNLNCKISNIKRGVIISRQLICPTVLTWVYALSVTYLLKVLKLVQAWRILLNDVLIYLVVKKLWLVERYVRCIEFWYCYASPGPHVLMVCPCFDCI